MSNILLVPVHLDALVLDYDQTVVETTADFSRLPYCTGKYDLNPDIANISEEIVSTPFQNDNLLLRAGIHLHWSLPDALTRARYVPDGSGTQDFPRVPNRWLVTRCNAGGAVEKEWLVESDYLFPPANALAAVGDGVAMPFRQGAGQPFRFMGRSFEVSRQARDDGAAYYPKLTAVGYGEPTFAAFYPNCYSVFGFFDDEYARKKDGRQYYLTGWYSDPDQDVLLTHVRDSLLLHANELTNLKSLAVKLRAQTDPLTRYLYERCSAATQRELNQDDPPESLRNHLIDDLNRELKAGSDLYRPERFVTLTPETRALAERRPQDPDAVYLNRRLLEEAFPAEIARRSPPLTSVLADSFKWTIAAEGQEFPTRMLCYARLVLNEAKPKLRDGRVTVAIGNTGTEALSACLAKKLRGEKAIVEDHLEAMHLSATLEHRQLDVGAKFSEARHEKGFTAVPGGTLWTIGVASTADSAADATDTPAEITLPHELGSLLNVLNQRQAEYDRAWQEIESLRVQLFSDWYKYMLCVYPPEDTRDAYPDVDEVASYVANRVTSLNKKIARTGKIVLDEAGGRVVVFVDRGETGGSLSTVAARLATTINNLQAFIEEHPDRSAYRLKQTSGPRYWRPTEPSILLDGSLAKPSARHGQDAPGKKLLETQLLIGADRATDLSDQNWRRKIREKIAEIGSSAGADKNFAFTTWDGQPWNPFLLEWEVEVFPVANKSNIDPFIGRFNENFITDNYQLAENDVDLSLKTGKGETTSAANLYSGRSILTPHASTQLVTQTEDYLEKEVLPQFYQEANVSVPGDDRDFLTENMAKIQKWYEARAKSALLKGAGPDEDRDPNLTAFRAWGAMRTPESLSQSLSGFNEALLMHKQTPQLHVADPLGFNDYQPFADSIGTAVSDSIYSAPAPQNDFNPIRSGMMKIHRLRLIDTFGQLKDLDVSKILMSESLDDGTDDPLVSLPPRLMQPARVNFRWLAADADEEEMNDHPATTPICGWVLANNLDNSLMIYDNAGRALGSLVKKDADSTWAPAPGGLGISSIKEISNPHLQKMVNTIKDWGGNFLDDFITAIDSALENIEPENFAHHQDLALLIGRPLALVRASVNLELKGLPVTHQGWNEFRQDMHRDGRDDNGFTSVRFPIRIGEYRQFNDGTVGYWKEDGEKYEDDVFFAPQSDDDVKFKGVHLKTHKSDPDAMVFFQTVESPPQMLSLLIDPRGLVHATTGILPAKAINIPPDQYAAALQSIEITFLSTPVLTDAGKIHLPLPDEAGYQWSWLQQDFHHTWSEVSSRGLVRKETFVEAFGSAADVVWKELRDRRWIELIDKKDETRASVTARDKRDDPSLSDAVKEKTDQIEDILDRAHIGPVDRTAKFSGQQEVREGWLKLSPAPVAQPSRRKL